MALETAGVGEYRIRPVTADSLRHDLETGHLAFEQWALAGLADAISKNELGFAVAETMDGQPLGQVGYNLQGARTPGVRELVGDKPGIAFMGVREQYQRKGIGQALMRWVLERIADAGFDGAFLAVEVGNEGAKRLYDRMGFVVRAQMDMSQRVQTAEGVIIEKRPCFIMEYDNQPSV